MPVLVKAWNLGESYLAALLSLAALGLVATALIARVTAPGDAPTSPDIMSLAGILVVCAVFLSGSSLVRDGKQRHSDVLVRIFSGPVQRRIEIAGILAALVFCGIVAGHGWQTFLLDQDAENAGQWHGIDLLALSLGLTLMAARYLVRLWLYLFRYNPATMMLRDDDIPPGS